MSKIRGDPLRVALAHPTRAALVSALNGIAEMSTVQLQEATDVTRYHLYHHLQQLEKTGIVENHRDQGRARWWRLTGPVELPGDDAPATAAAPTADLTVLPDEIAELIRAGADTHWVAVPGSAREAIAAKKLVEAAAAEWGLDLDLPFTFTPSGLLLIGQPRKKR